ncbi:TetR/AcrR family transcriptional regulator [Pelagibacterium halotolerans]|uniref:Transcriptional regulator, TetR family n=1 Tax=Pelagibacterium halotolerans (strain DSM 22347 / JCM 15775 / CGMCC 1.7692 / B2) TaxID=1082931 RepID=G4RBV1_PELHB|nr:TetR/AcrR family transcriptional regulator [Pelagibacterium halotolerans]AEQ50614.1 transcriptional regulator, TetR family [Pelagibacterium halotolerans B2]QJR19446.1 TetR/AcrR family transcriptional regulator [Pelagibacterium halotolerans]
MNTTIPAKRKNLTPQARRAQLVDCAQILFATKGYEATTIGDVMAMAGVSKGGFYHHFQSKEALLEALAERMALQALATIEPILEDPWLDPFTRLNRVLRQLRIRKSETAPDVGKAFDAAFQPGNIVLFDRIRRAITAIVAPVISKVIADGVAEKVFDVPDPESCVEIILHLNAAAYDAVSAAMAERDRGERGPALDRLYRMMEMQGIAVDRLLGLPDGSLTWIEPGTLEKILQLPAGESSAR